MSAAAPDMLEALKALAEWKLENPDIGRPGLPLGYTGNQIKDMVRKALAKAEGK